VNTEFFIASRIIRAKKERESSNTISGTRPIVRIAVAGISIGLAVMIVAVSIVTGFQKEIRDKVSGFGAHIVITNYDSNTSYEPEPVSTTQSFYPSIDTVKGIHHIQVFATKAGIIKTDDEIEGVVVKGVGKDFDWSFFDKHIIEGKSFRSGDSTASKSALVSEQIAKKLKLKAGDKLYMYFIQGQDQKARVFTISGIYKTGLEEFDNLYVLADIAHIQKLNGWEADQVAGFEIFIDDFKDLDNMGNYVYNQIGQELNAQTIKEIKPQIFDWLGLMDTNVVIIIVLMLLVAGFNMISALLIMIIERVQMIGILKALGMNNGSIRNIFIYNSVYLISMGMLIGNVVGISACLLQKHYGFITLPEESYYVKVVPVNLELLPVLMLNAGTLVVCTLMLIIPSYLVSRVSPLRAVRFN
jgi:lipoprotein-releasing system permease protein